MFNIFAIIAILLLPFNCMFTTKAESELEIVMIHYNFPRHDGDNKIVHMADTVWFIKSGNTHVFRMPGEKEIVNDDFLHPVILHYKYLLYTDSYNTGLLFDSINASISKRKIVDSFLARSFFGYTIKPIIKNYELQRTTADNDGNEIETYLPEVKPDRTYPDTTKLYYNARYNNLFYSFSKELDSAKGMKLFKFRFIYNADDPKKFNDPWPAKEFFWEIQEDTLLNKKEILDFIQRHKDQLHG